MKDKEILSEESQRLAALYRLQLLGTSPEKSFNDLVELASTLCDTPISLISLVDKDRIWIKARYGLEVEELERDSALCDFAIRQLDTFVVSDTTKDDRFCKLDVVTGNANIQFYAGVPLLSEDGFAVGVLSVLDNKPRTLSERQLSSLQMLANQARALLNFRMKVIELDESSRQEVASRNKLQEMGGRLLAYFNSLNDAVFLINPSQTIIAFNKLAEESIQKNYGVKIQIGDSMLSYMDTSHVEDYKNGFNRAFAGEEVRIESKVLIRQEYIWWESTLIPVKDAEGETIGVTLATKNIDKWKKAEEELKKSEQRLKLVLEGINDGWWDWDLVHNYLFYSDKWWEMVGLLPEELPVTPQLWNDLLHPEDAAYVDIFLEKALEDTTTKTYEVEFRLKHKKGDYVPVLSRGHILRNESGNPIRISGSNMDLTEIKNIQNALKQSKEFIIDITDNLPSGFIFQYVLKENDLEGRLSYVSSGVSELFGVSVEEALENPSIIHKCIYPDERQLKEAIDYSRQNITLFDFQYQVLVDGQIKWLHTRSTPKLLKDNSVRWDGITVEITEQKLATELIKKTKQEQQAILTAIPDLLFRFDNEDRYTYIHTINPSDLILPAEELLGKKLDEVLPEPVLGIIKEGMYKARLSGKMEMAEYFIDLPKQGITWFEARFMRTSQEEVLIIVRNITERRKAEEALQKSEDNMNTVFENTDVGYYLFDTGLKIVSFNAPAQYFTTAEFHQPLEIGNYFFDYFPEEYKSRLTVVINDVFEGKKINYERQFLRENGEEKWYHTRYSPVSNKEKKVVGMVMSTEDITERKRNEIALKKSFELVSEQNKRLLNFSYIVSHNLRSHTSNIKSILDLLPYADSEEERNEMIRLLVGVSNSLNETIFNLNEVVSIQTNLNLLIEPINLRECFNKTILVLSEQINMLSAQVHNLVDEEQSVDYNPAYLESILLNFLSNALKYSDKKRLPVISLSCTPQDGWLVLEIADNGIGIDMEKYGDQLFGMYKTFNGNADARGIGLFITKNQIEAMGGRIEVNSKVDVGTTFRVFIK